MVSIGELARLTGVKVPTIRYYESVGLLVPAARTEGNQRRYDAAACARLGFIAHARALGFPLGDIRALIALAEHPERPCADADRIAAEHLASVRARIARLRRLETELERIAGACAGDTAAECRVLEALSDHGACSGEH